METLTGGMALLGESPHHWLITLNGGSVSVWMGLRYPIRVL